MSESTTEPREDTIQLSELTERTVMPDVPPGHCVDVELDVDRLLQYLPAADREDPMRAQHFLNHVIEAVRTQVASLKPGDAFVHAKGIRITGVFMPSEVVNVKGKPDEHLQPTIEKMIETVQEQGCVKLKTGVEGIPRSITITPEGETIEVDTDEGRDDVGLDEIEEIVFVG
jgi:hypothetical protein